MPELIATSPTYGGNWCGLYRWVVIKWYAGNGTYDYSCHMQNMKALTEEYHHGQYFQEQHEAVACWMEKIESQEFALKGRRGVPASPDKMEQWQARVENGAILRYGAEL